MIFGSIRRAYYRWRISTLTEDLKYARRAFRATETALEDENNKLAKIDETSEDYFPHRNQYMRLRKVLRSWKSEKSDLEYKLNAANSQLKLLQKKWSALNA